MSQSGSSIIKRRGFSVDEVAEAYGVSRQKVYDAINDGFLYSFKVGHRRIIPQFALDAWERGELPKATTE